MADFDIAITHLTFELPSQLTFHPLNPKTHPRTQLTALAAALNEIGFVGAIIQNDRTGYVLDGHARVKVAEEQAPDQPIPVLHCDIDEDRERKLLLTYDPLARLAADDAENTRLLIETSTFADADLAAFVAKRPLPATDPRAEWLDMPEFEQQSTVSAFQLNVHFRSKDDVAAFEQLIGQDVPDTTKRSSFIWFPREERHHTAHIGYVSEADAT